MTGRRRSGAVALLALAVAATAPSARAGSGPLSQADPLAQIRAAEDARADTPEELAAILDGLRSADVEVQRLAVRALGRLERPSLVPAMAPTLSASAPAVRIEAANALAQAVLGQDAKPVASLLRERLGVEDHPLVRGALCRALGRLPYRLAGEVRAAEEAILGASFAGDQDASPAVLLGVARGLESLARLHAGEHPLQPGTRRRLAQLAARMSSPNDASAIQVRRLAMAALAALQPIEPAVVSRALEDPDAQVRRLAMVAASTADALEGRSTIVATGLRDADGMVRLEALRAFGRRLQAGEGCRPVLAALSDPSPHVRLLAIDRLGHPCGPAERDRILEMLGSLARQLPVPERSGASGSVSPARRAWHRPARAIVALASTAPERAMPLVDGFVQSEIWQARMYAARAAAALGAREVLERLATDRHDNVREAAISALSTLVGHEADALYVEALGRSDYQLLRTAARALEGTPRAADVVPVLLAALARVSAERRETSRDPRRAILERVGELGGDARAADLERYLEDFDPVIASLAADILTQWTGRRWTPRPRPLPPHPVPGATELEALARTRAVVHMQDGGRFELRLLAHEAPANVERFARLARSGYFDGLTFHRVAPNFVIQGGSPGANEYMGDGPYTRDEVGPLSHLRGTVGVSTRGRDTGDGQIFVNLVDNVRLDHNYTVFAQVTAGLEVVDAVLEGAVIERVEILEAGGAEAGSPLPD